MKSMDVVVFSKEHERRGGYLYRPTGDHEFVEGEGGVVRVYSIGSVKTVPYRPAHIENLAGKYSGFVQTFGLEPVIFRSNTRFRNSQQLFHVDGTLNVYSGVVYFKGVNSLAGIRRIKKDVGVYGQGKVYMALLTGALGVEVDVRFGCFLERIGSSIFGHCMSAWSRVIDLHPVVYLEMTCFEHPLLKPFSRHLQLRRILVTVSSNGTVIFRVACKHMIWTRRSERNLLQLCQRVLESLRFYC